MPLSEKAEALRRYLLAADEALNCEIIDGAPVYTLTKSGVAVRRRDVEELTAAGLLKAFGDQIDDRGPPACLVLAAEAKSAKTACGADDIRLCKNIGFCIDCAPPAVVEGMRSGEKPVVWHGAAP